MGHIKLAKADGEFDVVSADNVVAVKLEGGEITIFYVPGGNAVIKATPQAFSDEDVFEITKAIDVMDGTSGPAPLTKLSSNVTGVEVKA